MISGMKEKQDALMFFEDHMSSLPLFEAFEAKLYAVCPETSVRIQKTQITYSSRYVFACVSMARVKRKAELPDPYIVITLGLPSPLRSGRAAVQCEPYPGRWTVHIVVGSPEELDEELFAWVREAYDFARQKKRNRKGG